MSDKRIEDSWRFVRFLLVGVLNTFFSYVVYACLIFAGLQYALANLCALLAGLVFSFNSQKRLVFREMGEGSFVRFVLVWAVIYAGNVSVIAMFLRVGFDAYAAGALALPFVAVASYWLQTRLVFGRTKLSACK